MKSTAFKKHRYLGDPLNAVRIFSGLKADEMILLDISAGRQNRTISPELVREVGSEANMPFSVGGGVRSLEQIQELLAAGAERVVLGSEAVERPSFVKEAAQRFGSSSLSVCLDIQRGFLSPPRVYSRNASRASRYSPLDFAKLMQSQGAGELICQCVRRDGSMGGYDLELLEQIAGEIEIPVVGLGGAGQAGDLQAAYKRAPLSGLAAGSFFVYQGPKRGVLIHYPERAEMRRWFQQSAACNKK